MKAPASIENRASFTDIRYANCWEDADILLEALDVRPGHAYLSIASAGDNSLSLLSRSPSKVVAVDLSGAQLACVEIKKICFERLLHREMLQFLGFSGGADCARGRLKMYQDVAPLLSPGCRVFWDARMRTIGRGIIHTGKFEHYFCVFRRFVLPLIHSPATINALLLEKDATARHEFYSRIWNNRRWRLCFKIFFSRSLMGALGRDPEFFRFVKGSVADEVLARGRRALTVLPTRSNPYLHYIVTGSFGEVLPHYVRRENFDAIRSNMKALHLFKGTISDACRLHGPRFNGMNCSDIFEYMDDALFMQVARDLLDHCAGGALVAYWNMMVPRSIAAQFPGRAARLQSLSDALHERDKAFFYAAFHCDRSGAE